MAFLRRPHFPTIADLPVINGGGDDGGGDNGGGNNPQTCQQWQNSMLSNLPNNSVIASLYMTGVGNLNNDPITPYFTGNYDPDWLYNKRELPPTGYPRYVSGGVTGARLYPFTDIGRAVHFPAHIRNVRFLDLNPNQIANNGRQLSWSPPANIATEEDYPVFDDNLPANTWGIVRYRKFEHISFLVLDYSATVNDPDSVKAGEAGIQSIIGFNRFPQVEIGNVPLPYDFTNIGVCRYDEYTPTNRIDYLGWNNSIQLAASDYDMNPDNCLVNAFYTIGIEPVFKAFRVPQKTVLYPL